MTLYKDILLKHWGYDNFRDLQESIIESIAMGKDTLGLMPTGGGKSITFQVFSLSVPGVCLVITPLIALMKDQVENLSRRKIKAAAIYSGMSNMEIEIALNNVCNGDYKFLYLSPERLKNYYFLERLKHIQVNLITVDEAHCISQWGYDFRPSYLQIAEIRKLLPDTPVLALTATATPEVVSDIQDKLNFKKHNVLQKSFERKNLTYFVVNKNIEDKNKKLIQLVSKMKGTIIVYVRNRKKTKEYAQLLVKHGISADYYHAGLDANIRSSKQSAWQNNQIRVMVCTNAFGMGIDKPDVRLVVHMDLPDSLEAYFQEAGRAGRDGQKAWAILLANANDTTQLKRNMTTSFPELKKVVEVYNAICNYFQVPVGTGQGADFRFDIFDFAKKFKLDSLTIFNSIKILDMSNILSYIDDANSNSRIMFLVNRDDLYKFQVENHDLDNFIKILLRNSVGVFTDFVNINEDYLAKITNTPSETIIDLLKLLRQHKIIQYIPRTNKPIIHFISERLDTKALVFDKSMINEHKNRTLKRLESMLIYASSNNKCRSQQLLAYFGEDNTRKCNNCDVCREPNELGLSSQEFELISEDLKKILTNNNLLLEEIMEKISFDKPKTIKVIRWLFDNDRLKYNEKRQIYWNK